jgi:hypothetical protein
LYATHGELPAAGEDEGVRVLQVDRPETIAGERRQPGSRLGSATDLGQVERDGGFHERKPRGVSRPLCVEIEDLMRPGRPGSRPLATSG